MSEERIKELEAELAVERKMRADAWKQLNRRHDNDLEASAETISDVLQAHRQGYLEALGDCKDALLPIIKGKLAVAARQKGLELELHVENIIGNIYPDFGQAVYELELKSRAGKEENK